MLVQYVRNHTHLCNPEVSGKGGEAVEKQTYACSTNTCGVQENNPHAKWLLPVPER